MSLMNNDAAFPYVDIDAIYLKCGTNQRLKEIYRMLINQLYSECDQVVCPITGDDATNRHFTYSAFAVNAESYQASYHDEVYSWHVGPTGITVPYGNALSFHICSSDWLAKVSRSLRCIWHAARLIPNDDKYHRTFVNISIPWLAVDKPIDTVSDQELIDYAEIVLSSISGQVWVKNKQIISLPAYQ